MNGSNQDIPFMTRALQLAARGRGAVEPNPMVGCLIVRQGKVVAEGWHRHFGGPHAEIEALQAAGEQAVGATLFVTLEPCCHHGKTPPCTEAVLAAGVRRVVVAQVDPFPEVAGQGIRRLRAAGIQVETGLLAEQAEQLNAPYHSLIQRGRPWMIAKWAVTLDGKMATHRGDSKWISNEASRARVHALRGRVDAIMIGRGTAQADDPLLTARPPGPRTATRVIADSRAALACDSQLVRSVDQAPLLVAAGPQAAADDVHRLRSAGCEVYCCPGQDYAQRLQQLLAELGRRRMTNVLVEGGPRLLGVLFDQQLIDEVHVFIAPKLIGGEAAASPIQGTGRAVMSAAARLQEPVVETLDGDIYVHGPLAMRT